MTITEFVLEVSAKMGFARSNKFSVEIPRARNSNTMSADGINIMCESVSLPGTQILTTDYSSVRHSSKYPTGTMYEDVELTFALTSDYYARKFFDEWIASVITTTNDNYTLNYRSDFSRDVTINQLDENDKKIYSHKLRDAYPITIQNINLSNMNEDEISRFSVTLTYDKYEITNHK
jgi:hypothetical protein